MSLKVVNKHLENKNTAIELKLLTNNKENKYNCEMYYYYSNRNYNYVLKNSYGC